MIRKIVKKKKKKKTNSEKTLGPGYRDAHIYIYVYVCVCETHRSIRKNIENKGI